MDKAKRKQTILIGIFLVAILVTGYLVYTSFFGRKSSEPVPELGAVPDIIPVVPGAIVTAPSITTPSQNVPSSKLKTDLLTDPRFSQLVIFGEVPIEVGPVGRDNPFIPYEGYKSGGETGPG
ncbi:MAG: hypothetical protein WC650_05345 [Candidatus Doudnabacteria bacterium]